MNLWRCLTNAFCHDNLRRKVIIIVKLNSTSFSYPKRFTFAAQNGDHSSAG